MGFVMLQKWFLSFLIIFSMYLSAAVPKTELKIDHNWSVQFDKKKWSYLFLKPFNGITSHILESKNSGLQLILQKEQHSFSNEPLDSLIKKKCQEANRFYQTQRNGSAKVDTVNGKSFCFIEYKNVQNKQMALFVYPKKINKYSYDLLTYTWNVKSKDEKKEVVDFLAGVEHK